MLRTARSDAITASRRCSGRPIILNLAGAFTLATALGVDPEVIVAALRTLKPVSNRLEVVEERGVTWIRDAYNSNQFGFRAALEVVAALAGRAPVPGDAGRHRARRRAVRGQPGACRAKRRRSATTRSWCRTPTARRSSPDIATPAARARLVAVPNRTEAFRWLRETLQDGDAVILENDLPDLYERTAGVFWKTAPSEATAS